MSLSAWFSQGFSQLFPLRNNKAIGRHQIHIKIKLYSGYSGYSGYSEADSRIRKQSGLNTEHNVKMKMKIIMMIMNKHSR